MVTMASLTPDDRDTNRRTTFTPIAFVSPSTSTKQDKELRQNSKQVIVGIW